MKHIGCFKSRKLEEKTTSFYRVGANNGPHVFFFLLYNKKLKMSCVNSCGFLNYKCWLLGKELCRDETLAEQDVATYPSSISKTCTENCDLVAKCHTFLVDKERLTCDGDKNAGFNGLDAVSQGVKTPADVCFFHGAITAEEHNAINFNYVEYKLDEHFNRFEFYEEFGGNATFPQVTINGQKMGGCAETVKYLREHNMV